MLRIKSRVLYIELKRIEEPSSLKDKIVKILIMRYIEAMVKFPMRFSVRAEATGGIQKSWVSQADNLPVIRGAIPPEFTGPGTGYSPENLFGIAIINCLIATYKVYCEKAGVEFDNILVEATVVADKKPGLTSFVLPQVDLKIEVKGSSDSEKAKHLLETAIRDCPVANSIKSEKTIQFSVV